MNHFVLINRLSSKRFIIISDLSYTIGINFKTYQFKPISSEPEIHLKNYMNFLTQESSHTSKPVL